MPGHEHARFDDLHRGGHDLEGHLAGIHEGRLKCRALDRSLLVAALGHAIGGGQGPEGAGILIDEREQMPARVRKLDKLRLHPLLHIGVLLLPHGEVAHHGSQRRGERPRIGRGPSLLPASAPSKPAPQ